MARLIQQASIHTTGTSYENEPIIKSDAESSDVMQWLASTGTSNVKIIEDADNNVALQLDGETLRNNINGDGAGLHFDGSAGNVDISNSGSPPILGTKFSMEFVLKADVWPTSSDSTIIDFQDTGTGGRFALYSNDGDDSELGVWSVSSFDSFGVRVLDDLKAHHLVVTVDGTSAILYDNGNQVGTADISTSNIDDCTVAKIGSNFLGASCFNGTIYRARLYNYVIDAKAAFEGSNVDFADQWGSQTSLVDAAASVFTSGVYSWTPDGTNTIDNIGNALVITYVANAGGAYTYLRQTGYDLTTDLTVGKKYRLIVDAKYAGGVSGVKLRLNDGAENTDSIALTTSLATYIIEFTAQSATGGLLWLDSMVASNVVTIDNWYLREIGAVTDWDFSAANPTQSNQLQDRSSNSVDGTINSGVVQVNPVEQLNANQLRVSGTTPLVGVGLAAGTTPSQILHLESTTPVIRLSDSDSTNITQMTGYVEFHEKSTNVRGGFIGYGSSGDQHLQIRNETSSGSIRLQTASVDRVTINSAGLATFANGIAFSGQTDAASGTTARTLNHYEEGTWTPTYTRAGNAIASGITYTKGGDQANGGRYTRVGNLVSCWFDLETSAFSPSGTGDIYISGLPFVSDDVTNTAGYGAIQIRSHAAIHTDYRIYPNSCFIVANSTHIKLQWMNSSGVDTEVESTSEMIAGRLTGAFSYYKTD